MLSFKNEFNRPYRAIIPINLMYIKLSYRVINVIMISGSYNGNLGDCVSIAPLQC